MDKKSVLIADDEASIVDVCRRYLEREGYEIYTAGNGQDALQIWQKHQPDLIILDLMMPVIDGWRVCETIRTKDETPILMLTAKSEDYDRLFGLTIGANDYMSKPFNPQELVLRVRSIFRLMGSNSSGSSQEKPSTIELGGIVVNTSTREVLANGKPVSLTVKEFDLLLLLITHPRQVFSRSQLLRQVWETDYDGDTTTVTVHLRRLREKIEADPSHPQLLETVWGIGYRFDPGESE
ncbi:response regulator transcription factor [Halobacillus salinarum]|uniref:Response regulator transcription factor n=1 Tax=Halobacillus salinarum TaxID=2932257 RepID=A0ABY4EJ43_9BACI|nr:response regulator transcription factor [Halobacillus salinarum]UOQ44482.1 response regulator transcription factor [Halobacillus salinarum]